MRAVTFDPSTDRFAVRQIPLPTPGPDDALVRVDACGLNPVDAKIVQWKTSVADMSECWVPGLDVSGTIESVGRDVKGWKTGDRVLYHGNMFRPSGGFAEYAVQRATTLLHHPSLSASVAASTPCAGWTAWRALIDKLNVGAEDTLLIGGGSGGVGGFAVQIAKAVGVGNIIATCSTKNHEYVRELGASHLIDYRKEDIVSRVMQITEGRGVSRALDTVGSDNDIPIANSLAFDGEIVELVTLLRPEAYKNAFARGLTFHQLSLGAAHGRQDTEHLIVNAGARFSELLELGRIRVPELQTVSLKDVPAALDEIRQQRTVGKIVLVNE